MYIWWACMYRCSQVHISLQRQRWMLVEDKGEYCISSLVVYHFIYWDKCFLLNSELADLANLSTWRYHTYSKVLGLQVGHHRHPSVYVGIGDPLTEPHSCKAISITTKISGSLPKFKWSMKYLFSGTLSSCRHCTRTALLHCNWFSSCLSNCF